MLGYRQQHVALFEQDVTFLIVILSFLLLNLVLLDQIEDVVDSVLHTNLLQTYLHSTLLSFILYLLDQPF